MKLNQPRSIAVLALLGLSAATSLVEAQTIERSPSAYAPPASASRFGPSIASTDLPIIPHEKQPDVRPYPEYLAEALKLTRLSTDERFKTVRLRTAPGTERRYVVLPVQTEAFGFTPAFRALLAAQLDHELAARRIDGNRQTDVVDAYGPFARRLDESTLKDLATANPSANLLGLYVGHDAIDKAYLTLVLRDGDRTRSASRDLALPAKPREAMAAMSALLPALVDELQLGGRPVPVNSAAPEPQCKKEAWQLASADVRDVDALACHALIIGTLLPEFDDGSSGSLPTMTRAKYAWLAAAYVEAGHWHGTAASKAIQELAWSQLRLAEDSALGIPVQSTDPVVGPLTRLLSAHQRTRTSPTRSVREATARYVEETAQNLPAFARAVFVERGNYAEAFRRVDLCAIEINLPGTMPSPLCRSQQEPVAPPPGRANASQVAMYQEWRLFTFYKDIGYFGHVLGQRERLTQLLGSIPDDVARHPFIRRQRFREERFDAPPNGGFRAYLEYVRRVTTSFMQSSADLQQYDSTLFGYSHYEHSWIQNSNVTSDPTVSRLLGDEARLFKVLSFDRFATTETNRRTEGARADFLAAPPAVTPIPIEAQAPVSPAGMPSAAPVPIPVVSSAPPPPLFETGFEPPVMTDAQLRAEIEQFPTDMESRVKLAIQLLKQGKHDTDARRVIDGYPANRRSDGQVSESHMWADPAHAFFFASDMNNAKQYYERVRDIGTGSDSDLHALVRLRQIEGDIPGAITAASDRLRRYDGDFVRRDLAGMLFMAGRNEQAWQVVTPHLASTGTFQLWVGALVGQRADRIELKAINDWIAREGLEGAQIKYQDSSAMYLHLYAVADRVPTEADIELLMGPRAYRNDRWVASARLARMAMQETFSSFRDVRPLLAYSHPKDNRFLRPLFTWAAWHATAGNDPELDAVRRVDLSTGDFDSLLSKSMLLALEGRTDASLEFLRAARYQMSELARGSANVDRPVPSPYEYARAGYLMFAKTKNEAYRTETLRFARAHQKMFPFWGWSYALEALLERNEKSRAVAICRAKQLDPSSHFLSLVKQAKVSSETVCKSALWSTRG